jgi:pyruvate dehydrogenase E2 component (dihydrolipoamide acetyltransferase)
MAQDTAILVQWLRREGETITKGEPLAEIETDKAKVEIEAPASGVLVNVTAAPGDVVPVGQTIALILSLHEALPRAGGTDGVTPRANGPAAGGAVPAPAATASARRSGEAARSSRAISPLAARMAAEHHIDVSALAAAGKRVQKADVQTYLQQQSVGNAAAGSARLTPASPKARRLAAEHGQDVAALQGTGPGGAVLAADVLAALRAAEAAPALPGRADGLAMSNAWRIMAERTTQSWISAPHFYLMREVQAQRLSDWREHAQKRFGANITYTDLLVKLVAAMLREHPRLNVSWSDGKIIPNNEVHVGIAVATEDGVVVPVIHQADRLHLREIAERRQDVVTRAQAGKLRPEDVRGGTFTISNLGMYGVDAFTAILNPPQVAILAVGRIAPRVVPVHGQPQVQPTMMLSLSCDHRAVDGARGAQFLSALAELIEEPLGLLG